MIEGHEILGLPLDEAIAHLKARGVVPHIETTASPRDQRTAGTLRVVRVIGDTLTVARFPDALNEAVSP